MLLPKMLIVNIHSSTIHGASGAIAPGATSDESDELAQKFIDRGFAKAVEEVSDEDFFNAETDKEEEETTSESIVL